MPENSEKEILEDILNGVEELIVETLMHRQELKDFDEEIAATHRNGQITDLRFELEKQAGKRAFKNVDFCLKSLERQKKIALMKLRELES